jgi:6,7-dimethyl-8-ribityllumazine synthase
MSDFAVSLNGAGLRIGIVRGRFNESIGATMLEACRARLAELGVASSQVDALSVPGSLEVPLVLQKLAATGHYDALIALGAVIRGETYHFEIVANECAAGISSVALDTGVPIAMGILTTETDAQAEARAAQKGRDCAEVAVEMANLLRAVARAHK